MTRILLAGGGSGGHVTPLAVVAGQLDQQSDNSLALVTDKSYQATARSIFHSILGRNIDTHEIFAGKFRRYAHRPWWWHIVHLSVLLPNIKDLFYVLIGTMQSILIIKRFKPNVVFCKGGYVCLPVGIAARLCHIPLVLHDSDSVPGLTNRILSRWARAIAVGADPSLYQYPQSLLYDTGTPVDSRFKSITDKQQSKLRQKLGFDTGLPLLLVIGGGTGADSLNSIIAEQAKHILKKVELVHFTGKEKTDAVYNILTNLALDDDKLKHYHVIDFTTDMHLYIQAADLIISRAGATAIQEIIAVGKPLILVPGKQLAGGHQVKNALQLEKLGAAVVCDEAELETNGELLVKSLTDLLKNDKKEQMVHKMIQLRKPRATDDIVKLIKASASYERKGQ